MSLSVQAHAGARHFVTLGMFIIDEFQFHDENDQPTGRTLPAQIGGGGTYATIGTRIWLPQDAVGMIIDKGHDFPSDIRRKLQTYGLDMWYFREQPDKETTRALNSYRGDIRGFAYLTPRIRITPNDLKNTKLQRPTVLHFICSPSRAAVIMSEVGQDPDWHPVTVYEPIPYRCVPEELPALKEILPQISVLSPNADEALALLSMYPEPTKPLIEEAAAKFLEFGVGHEGRGAVIIRSGAMGAYIITRERGSRWIPAYWTEEDIDSHVIDVTGAGNSFLGGLSAGVILARGNIYEAMLYATVSASFIIEQEGLPSLTRKATESGEVTEEWNGDSPRRRLEALRARVQDDTGE